LLIGYGELGGVFRIGLRRENYQACTYHDRADISMS
jgi:hypothetical protein